MGDRIFFFRMDWAGSGLIEETGGCWGHGDCVFALGVALGVGPALGVALGVGPALGVAGPALGVALGVGPAGGLVDGKLAGGLADDSPVDGFLFKRCEK